MSKEIEVCFSPKLFNSISIKENYITIIVDILRATTSICTAFEYGVDTVIPVATLDEAKLHKENGYLVAAERDGKKLDFADYGNSPFDYMNEDMQGKTLVYTTTNGIQALLLAKNSDKVALGSFANYTALLNWLHKQDKNIVILCSGWENTFCLEDTLFAGLLSNALLQNSKFVTNSDSTYAAISLWNDAKDNVQEYISKMSHVKRLQRLDKEDDIKYAFKIDTCKSIPVLDNDVLINVC